LFAWRFVGKLLHKFMKQLQLRLSLAVVFLAAPLLSAATYDAFADFSVAANPNGVWAYGYSSTLSNLGLNFTPMNTGTNCNTGLECWQLNGGLPQIIKNGSGAPFSDGGSVLIPANELHLHPGSGGIYSILRWTAPTTGAYDIQGAFTVQDLSANSVTLDIVGLGYSDTFVSQPWGTQKPFSYTNTAITAGTSLYFAVGDAGNYTFDSTGLKLTITDAASGVPEPGSLSTAALGVLGGLGMYLRRRRNR
jgi:hypothetical protein